MRLPPKVNEFVARDAVVEREKYYSPQNVADVVESLCTFKTGYVDPCAGENHLFRVLPTPKVRFDIEDGHDFSTYVGKISICQASPLS